MSTIAATTTSTWSYRSGGNQHASPVEPMLEVEQKPAAETTSSEDTQSASASNPTAKLLEKLALSGPKSLRDAVPTSSEISDEVYAQILIGLEGALRAKYTLPAPEIDFSNEPALHTYATITRGGEVVAYIDNQGHVTNPPYGESAFDGLLIDSVNGTNGPALAQARAEQVAELIGGVIVIADTAITQSEFERLPPISDLLKIVVDVEAMEMDPLYQQIQESKRARQERLAEHA